MFILLWAAENVTMPPLKIWTNARNYLRAPSGTAERVFQEGRGKQSRFAKRWGLPWLLKNNAEKKNGKWDRSRQAATQEPGIPQRKKKQTGLRHKAAREDRMREEGKKDFVILLWLLVLLKYAQLRQHQHGRREPFPATIDKKI